MKNEKDAFSKDGGSPAETPWHQDESYWPDLPDKRALSFWSERNEFPMSSIHDVFELIISNS